MNRHSSTRIDLATWNRAEHYAVFRTFTLPHFSLTTRLDATRLMTQYVPQGASLYRACLYAMGVGANAVEALRTRFDEQGGPPVVYSGVDLSSTVATPDGGFAFGYTDFHHDWPTFDKVCAAADAEARTRASLTSDSEGRRDVIYLSCLPWVDMFGMTHAISGPDDDIPRVAWGKVVQREGRYEFGCTVAVHHALTDGAHLAAFFGAVQTALDSTDFI